MVAIPHDRCLSSRARGTPRSPSRKIGVILPNWIGDVVMATPALRALRSHLGRQAQLVGIMNHMAADVLSGTNFVDHIVHYERRSKVSQLSTVVAELRRHRLESLLLFTNSLSTAVLAWFARSGQRIGYRRYARGLLLTTGLAPPRRWGKLVPVSAVDYYLNLVRAVGCTCDAPRLELAVTEGDRLAVDEIFTRLAIDDSRPLVTLNNGGGYGPTKKWPTTKLLDLARRLVADTSASVLVVGGPAEQTDLASVQQSAGSDRIHTLAGVEPSIGVTKACVERSQVLVSTDSGVRHFAAAFDVPCVTLFGPSDPRWSENYHAREHRLRTGVVCSPCGRRMCPLSHHRCMNDLSVDRVFRAVAPYLEPDC